MVATGTGQPQPGVMVDMVMQSIVKQVLQMSVVFTMVGHALAWDDSVGRLVIPAVIVSGSPVEACAKVIAALWNREFER
jgi:hypothetical protein